MLAAGLEFIFSKVGEKLVEYGLHTVKDITKFKLTLKDLERNWQSLGDRASDIEEEIKNRELIGRKKRKREVENWLNEVKKIESEFLKLEDEVQGEGFIRQFFDGDRVAKLNAKVGELVEQSRHFGELVLDVDGSRGEELLTRRLVGEEFEKKFESIWELLVTDNVSSIGVYGMGGVGKTTLTKHIHNKILKDTLYCAFWITVSQEFSIKKLQDEVAHVIGVDLSDENNEDKRAARLNRTLSQRKNFVLILDDVWENISLEKVGDPVRIEGCRLMITTRSKEVCCRIGCQEIIEVEKLHREEAWTLFSETLGPKMTLAPQVQEIAKSMAKVCDGLPLGIITLAGSMRGVTAIHLWENALEELNESIMGLDEMEDKVFKVLKYSFDRLDRNTQREKTSNGYTKLQHCFLYCSLYPEDYEIPRVELIKKFILEELVDKRRSRKAQVNQVHAILDQLVNVCLLEKNRRDFNVDCVKMHDLVRAMALKITKGKTMVIGQHNSLKEILNEEEWTKDLEKMSLMKSGLRKLPPSISPNCPKLSTLLLCQNSLTLIADSFFSQMRGLCILDLSRTKIQQLPNSLSDLESLKALLLGGCISLVSVPYLGKLKALMELDLSSTRIKEVPQGMEELVNLKFLSMGNIYGLKELPKSLILKFPYLQHLYLPEQIQAPLEEIESLKQLEVFRGRIKDLCGFNQFIRSAQNKAYKTCYSIMVGQSNHVSLSGARYNELILLQIDLKKGEEKDVILLAHDTKHLKILKCEGIECIWKSTTNALKPHSLSLQTLADISLLWLPDFMGFMHLKQGEIGDEVAPSPSPSLPPPSQAVFPSLRKLEINQCNKIKKLGLLWSEFPDLEHINIKNCEEIEEIIEVAADDDGRGGGEGEAHVVVSLPRLKYLSLSDLPRLKSICKATIKCSSIERIHVMKCRALKKLPLFFEASTSTTTVDGQSDYSPPPALKRITVHEKEREWWESLEWEHPYHNHLLQPFLHFSDIYYAV